jgi:stage II sporulation protein AA (anti-sigma F factor antagonist)
MTAVNRRYEQGAPSVLRHEQEAIGDPRDDQVLVRQMDIGVNHAGIHYRNGHADIDGFPSADGFVRNSSNKDNTMTAAMTRPAPQYVPDRSPLYFRSNGDTTVLEIWALGAEPTIQDKQAIRLAVAGEIDILTADGLRDTLVQALHRYRPIHVGVDLAGVTFMDACGVSALLKFAIAARRVDCAISVTNPQSNVYKVLEITGLLEEFGVPTDRTPPAGTDAGAGGQALTRRIDAVVDSHSDRQRRRITGPVTVTPTPHQAGYVRQREIPSPTRRTDRRRRAQNPQPVRTSRT